MKKMRKNFHLFNQEDMILEVEINQLILKVDLNRKIIIKFLKNSLIRIKMTKKRKMNIFKRSLKKSILSNPKLTEIIK